MGAGEFAGIDQLYRTVVGLYAFQDHRQPNSGAGHLASLFLLALKKGLKYLRPLMFRDSRACVRELEHKNCSPYGLPES